MIQDQFVGIAGVDRALTDVRSELQAIKPFETAEFVLISRRGRIIAATFDPNLKAQTVESTPIASILLPFYQSRAHAESRFIEDTTDGTRYLFDAAFIPHGQWTLVMRVEEEEVFAVVWHSIGWRIATGIAGLIVILAILWWLSGSIAGRVSRAAAIADQVAQGDLTADVQVTGGDETGRLLAASRTMIGSLNSLIRQVKRSSIQLTSTATRIAASAKTQESSVNEFGSSTTQIAAAVNEISATSQELCQTMNEVTSSANETAALADSGRTGLDAMRQAMETLVEANRSISGKLSVINQKAQNINRVVITITKVADQTNLLSLNAAIEAEKAGEYGKGFAVVAREIRRLADQTAVATLDIDRMVKEMQSSVSAGVMEMDKFSGQIRGGVDEVGRISQQLGGIMEHVHELTTRFDAVQQGMNAQTDGAQQISAAMTQLTQAAKSSADSVASFNQAVAELHTAVNDLRQEISRFKTDEA